MKKLHLFLFLIPFLFSCSNRTIVFDDDFNLRNDRIWIGQNYWQVPLEEWKLQDQRIECLGNVNNSRLNILTSMLQSMEGDFSLSIKLGLLEKGTIPGSAGFLIGVMDDVDPDIKSLCYFGKGIPAGVSLEGFAFLGDQKISLPENFNWKEIILRIYGENNDITMDVMNPGNQEVLQLKYTADKLEGLMALSCNFGKEYMDQPGNSTFWFDDIRIKGSKIIAKPENAFGPVLWAMYTLSNKKVRLMAFLPPVGKDDNQEVSLQFMEDGKWIPYETKNIDPDSRTAIFSVDNWDPTADKDYRVRYVDVDRKGKSKEYFYTGKIRKDPVDQPLRFAGMTCQNHDGFPYTPVKNNLLKLDPDFLYFSGDQIYETNGGYGIIREPAELSIVNYLGKYYLFGWVFGDLMRDRPTVCTPDDHDVYHGNLWGESGKHRTNLKGIGEQGGFLQPTRMVNVVNRTQCGNLPDPYDSETIDDGMTVWYTSLTYGRVSFAIVSDRIFKSAPERVANWETRKDHLKKPLPDPSVIQDDDLKLLGDRQIDFLNHWIYDWKGADMKVLLSQTTFCNAATHHGPKMEYVYGDLDSGGWPKNGRDKAVDIMRKCFAFHINGDQHLPSLAQYGIDNQRDAGWSFCTPAIAVGYQRAFLPDELGRKVNNKPPHNLPNTGEYVDAFGNKFYLYAIGNPDKKLFWDDRYFEAQMRSSGFGMITFNQKTRDIIIDSWKFLADVENPGPEDQFPGWPVTLNQLDNYGLDKGLFLPEIEVDEPDQLVTILDENEDLVYIIRMAGNKIKPKVFDKGEYSVIIGEGENLKKLEHLSVGSDEKIMVSLK